MANETSQFRFDFYSGSQITVWFGNIFIDDISSIQWSRTQNKVPIYGYASQLFDAVASGIVIIQGSFVVNFRQQGYMSAIMSGIKTLYQSFGTNSSYSKAQNEDTWPMVTSMINTHLRNGTFGPQTVQEMIDLGNSGDFFALAKEYEKIIWDNVGENDKPVRFPSDVQQAKDIPGGFNIMISYGSPSDSDMKTQKDVMQSTTKTLTGVHLTGESQIISVGGQPTQEQYSFIARNSDEFIGSSR